MRCNNCIPSASKHNRIMKNVKLFYQKNCPYCRKAIGYIEELKGLFPELGKVEIEMIEETESPEITDGYDYFYVPTFYIDEVKVHEGEVTREKVEEILRKALK